MAALTAYFDAAGDEHSQVALAIGGFISSAERWREWEKPWRERLAKDGLEVFHRNELGRMAAEKREQLEDDLCGILVQHAFAKSGVAVLHRDVQSALPESLRDEWRITSYALCGINVAKEMMIWLSQWSGRMPDLVYEDGDVGKGKLITLLVKHGYPAPIFKLKKRSLNRKSGLTIEGASPLEAADLLAYRLFDRARAM